MKDQNGITIETMQDVSSATTRCGNYIQGGYFVTDIHENDRTVTIKEYDDDEGYIVEATELEIHYDLREIAEENGFEIIETTSGSNGYPQNLKYAIVGFNDFEQAQCLADKYGFQIQSFEKKDGWSLWKRNGSIYNPYQNSASDFGDDYSEEDEYSIRETIADQIKDAEDPISFLASKLEILQSISDCSEDESVVTHCGEYYDTIKRESMSYSHDSRCYTIGLTQN